jgi:hypothetical protein
MRKPGTPLKFDLDLDALDDGLLEKLENVGVQVEAKSRQTGGSRQPGGNCGMQLLSIKQERQDVANSGRPDRTLVSIKQEVGHVGLNAAEMNDHVKKTVDSSLAHVKVEAPHHVDLRIPDNVDLNNLPVAS